MAINADKPHLWKADVNASVDLFNQWFMLFAPKAYRDSRVAATIHVEEGIRLTQDLTALTPDVLKQHPGVLQVLRMSTCPPLARDRLIGLAYASKNLVSVMEEKKAIPLRMPPAVLQENLARIADTISRMLDVDIFPWIASKAKPTEEERHRASTIVADRLCGAVSDPIIRNAQEKRQLAMIAEYLQATRLPPESPPRQQTAQPDGAGHVHLSHECGHRQPTQGQHPDRRGDPAEDAETRRPAHSDRSQIRRRFHEHQQAAEGRGRQDRPITADLRQGC